MLVHGVLVSNCSRLNITDWSRWWHLISHPGERYTSMLSTLSFAARLRSGSIASRTEDSRRIDDGQWYREHITSEYCAGT